MYLSIAITFRICPKLMAMMCTTLFADRLIEKFFVKYLNQVGLLRTSTLPPFLRMTVT